MVSKVCENSESFPFIVYVSKCPYMVMHKSIISNSVHIWFAELVVSTCMDSKSLHVPSMNQSPVCVLLIVN